MKLILVWVTRTELAKCRKICDRAAPYSHFVSKADYYYVIDF